MRRHLLGRPARRRGEQVVVGRAAVLRLVDARDGGLEGGDVDAVGA
jgi:hypothetical protein